VRGRKLPPLPRYVHTPIGELPVMLVPPAALGKRGAGYYHPRQFVIRIANDMVLRAQWHTFWHEHGHLLVDLSGLTMAKDKEEAFCSTYATIRMNEMLYG
jgi:Zn-dependent peptidase ImmA (M78 family)